MTTERWIVAGMAAFWVLVGYVSWRLGGEE